MNRFVCTAYKVFFFILCIWNIGIIQCICSPTVRLDPSNPENESRIVTKKYTSFEERGQVVAHMQRMYYKILDTAKRKAERSMYSPYDYFTDMRDINAYRKKYGLKENPMNGGELQWYMQKSLTAKTYSYDDVTKAREIAMPGSIEYDKRDISTPVTWIEIGNWVLHLYLKMLPFAFILLLIWMYEENKKLSAKNPISFIVSLMMYPVVIGISIAIWWRSYARDFIGHVTVRRTKQKFFSLLTDDEIALVKTFATSSIRYADFCKRIQTNGRIFRHTFLIACIATLCMSCISQQTIVGPKITYSSINTQHLSMQSTHFSKEKPDLPIWVEYDHANIFHHIIKECHILFLLSSGYAKRIEHIPLVVLN